MRVIGTLVRMCMLRTLTAILSIQFSQFLYIAFFINSLQIVYNLF